MVWVKGKKVTLKILQAEYFRGTLQEGLFRETLTKCNLALDFLASSMCFLRALFTGTFTCKLLVS